MAKEDGLDLLVSFELFELLNFEAGEDCLGGCAFLGQIKE
jgi:hypothetical protein